VIEPIAGSPGDQDVSNCTCVYCGQCNGRGGYFDLAPSIYDDDWIVCPDCYGSGVTEKCDYCANNDDEDGL
jgi:DnaJ-class molecular chaperone